MAADTLLCPGGSGPARSEPEGLSQPTKGGRSKRGLVNGLAEEQRDTGGESSPLFSPSHSCCHGTCMFSGHEPSPAGCLCLTHHPAGLPCLRGTAVGNSPLKNTVLAAWITSTYYSISLYSCAADGFLKSL